jgi:hypothetical protein
LVKKDKIRVSERAYGQKVELWRLLWKNWSVQSSITVIPKRAAVPSLLCNERFNEASLFGHILEVIYI